MSQIGQLLLFLGEYLEEKTQLGAIQLTRDKSKKIFFLLPVYVRKAFVDVYKTHYQHF